MAKFQHIQRDFSGGEISSRMLMRQNTEVYQKSALEMTNFMPTLQGSANRMPGTRYIGGAGVNGTEGRIIPYLTTANERSLLVLGPESIRLIRNVTARINRKAANLPDVGTTGVVIYREPLIEAGDFSEGFEPWELTPELQDGVNGDPGLGTFWNRKQRAVLMSPRRYKYPNREPKVSTATIELDVAYPTAVGTFTLAADYIANPPQGDGNYEFTVVVSTNSDFSSPIFEETYTEENYTVGSEIRITNENVSLNGGADYTGSVYIKVELTAEGKNGGTSEAKYSSPQYALREVQFWANNEVELTEASLTAPYLAEDLQDIQYVQSPYGDPDGFKELVLTHPKYFPRRFYFDTQAGQYVLEEIPFVDQDGAPNVPSEWAVNNYPAACSSYNGRLVLAGGQSFLVATNDPVASVSETIWTTAVGKWDTFTSDDEVDPDDSVILTTTYRSPIQWVYGQKSLLVGALEFEYSATGDGIFAPGNLGIFLHSTHGSTNVQPAGFGEAVLFPSDGGTKVRRMNYQDEDQGWGSADMTLFNPEICYPKITRMVRVRNPHQQCWCLKSDGTVAVFSSEDALAGWCVYQLNGGTIRDICVVTDESGIDVPFMTVERRIDGQARLYIEAIADFTESRDWDYTGSTKFYQFDSPTDTIPDLTHLEGKRVQVYENEDYLGLFTVTGGQVVLDNNAGGTFSVKSCKVGISHWSTLRLLPPEKQDPGAESRYTDFTLRVRSSTAPRINGERPAERRIKDGHASSPELVEFADYGVYLDGWNELLQIEVAEQLPIRCEILGMFGKLTSNSL